MAEEEDKKIAEKQGGEEEEEEAEKQNDEVWCPVCYKEFRTKTAAAVHKWRAHGVGSVGWHYATTTACEACEMQWWSRKRLVNHWRSTPACFAVITSTKEPVDPSICRAEANLEAGGDAATRPARSQGLFD